MTMVEAGLTEMEQAGAHLREPELYGQMRQSVETLRDPELLRQRVAKGARPDGTVEFSSTRRPGSSLSAWCFRSPRR
jgi:hypothetical protein